MTRWGRFANGYIPNPYGMRDFKVSAPGNINTIGKLRLDSLGGAAVFVTLGQSRIANLSASGATAYTPTNGSDVININPYDGRFYKCTSPILGPGTDPTTPHGQVDWQGRLGDKLIDAAKYAKVAFVPIGISGTYIADWEAGGTYNPRVTSVCALLTDLGITPIAWLLQIGTADSIAGTSEASWAASARSLCSHIRGQSGRSGDAIMIAQDTIRSDNGTSTAIRAAVVDVAGDTDNYLGPDIDTLTYSTNGDGSHFNNTGNDACAGLWDTAIRAAF